jgi:hypothetical protein
VEGTTIVFAGSSRDWQEGIFAAENGARPVEIGKPILAGEAEKQSTDPRAFLAEHELEMSYLKRLSDGLELKYWRSSQVNSPRRYV